MSIKNLKVIINLIVNIKSSQVKFLWGIPLVSVLGKIKEIIIENLHFNNIRIINLFVI